MPVVFSPISLFRKLYQYTKHGMVSLLGSYVLICEDADDLLFTNNDTNFQKLYGTPNPTPYVKDAFHDYLVHGRQAAINPEKR